MADKEKLNELKALVFDMNIEIELLAQKRNQLYQEILKTETEVKEKK